MSNVHLTGKHLIAGTWLAGTSRFQSSPFSGGGREFSEGTADLIAQASSKAEEAFESYGWSSRKERAVFLRAIAEEIEAIGAMVTEVGCQETGLPKARLDGERGRTTGQLRLFADHIEKGDYLDKRHDAALPKRAPLPRPDLKMIQRPIGPVAVFGASNFPLAFSTAGGDTAAALAAGCPVIVKGHPAHPGTGELIAQAIAQAMNSTQQHPGVFSFIQGHSHTVGLELFIRAGGLANVNAMLDSTTMTSEGAQRSAEIERIEGFSKVIWDQHKINKGDIIIIISNSGRNAMPIEMAMIAKKNKIPIIAITSMQQTKKYPSRHSSEKKLYEIAKSMKAFGWSRELDSKKQLEKKKIFESIKKLEDKILKIKLSIDKSK